MSQTLAFHQRLYYLFAITWYLVFGFDLHFISYAISFTQTKRSLNGRKRANFRCIKSSPLKTCLAIRDQTLRSQVFLFKVVLSVTQNIILFDIVYENWIPLSMRIMTAVDVQFNQLFCNSIRLIQTSIKINFWGLCSFEETVIRYWMTRRNVESFLKISKTWILSLIWLKAQQ